MLCALCGKPIEGYSPELHRLLLSDGRSAELCQPCVDDFLRWQQALFARLYPTAAARIWARTAGSRS